MKKPKDIVKEKNKNWINYIHNCIFEDMSWICPKCETENPERLKICEVCDTPRESSSVEILKEKLREKYSKTAYKSFIQNHYSLLVSADQGNSNDQYQVGEWFYSHNSNEEYMPEAVFWLKKAALQGHRDAQYKLAICYETGRGVTKDSEQAIVWYRKAASNGNKKAKSYLAYCYLNGRFVKKDINEALKWFGNNLENINEKDANNIGICYLNGDGVAADKTKAVQFFRKAAEKGYPPSLYNLGLCYEKGIGVDMNINTAKSWYEKAATRGHSQAQKCLSRIKRSKSKILLQYIYTLLYVLLGYAIVAVIAIWGWNAFSAKSGPESVMEHKVFLKGKIADKTGLNKIGLTMQLSIADSTVEGTEHYDKQSKNAIIIIKGRFNKNGSMTLSEYDGNKKAGVFEGVLSENEYKGTFTNSKGKSFDFYLSVVDSDALAKVEIHDLQKEERTAEKSSEVNHPNQESLNDIRFSHFKSEDWYDNEYIRAVRNFLNNYYDGVISDQDLDPYRQIISGYFVLNNIEPCILGGAYIQFVFFEKPELLFSSWVYSDVDEEKEVVLGYEVRGVKVEDEETGFSKDDIMRIMSEHPEIKFW